jgi:predicted glycoside hydrolase/deacetylase ChbG (UPF0249 family)
VSIVRGLIVHADDYGETEEITRGISLGLEAGVVTSTTILANMPGTAFALREVRRFGDAVSFGLHLNLCEGQPLTTCPSLTTPDGRFHSKRTLAARALARLVSPAEVQREVDAQAALLADAGVKLSHIDGHKHLHQLPIVREAVVRSARRFGLQRVRRTLLGRGLPRGAATTVREVLAWRAGRLFSANRLRYPTRVVDLAQFQALRDAAQGAALLDGDGIVEVFCHPGTPEGDVEKPGSCRRSEELAFLLSRQWADTVRASRREPMNYWRV